MELDKNKVKKIIGWIMMICGGIAGILMEYSGDRFLVMLGLITIGAFLVNGGKWK